jgi:hypothetical protein
LYSIGAASFTPSVITKPNDPSISVEYYVLFVERIRAFSSDNRADVIVWDIIQIDPASLEKDVCVVFASLL